MPKSKVQLLEGQIEKVEGFAVKVASTNGKPKGLSAYEWSRMARQSHTVEDWRRRRFDPYYVGVTATVLLADGRAAKDTATLGQVRATYAASEVESGAR